MTALLPFDFFRVNATLTAQAPPVGELGRVACCRFECARSNGSAFPPHLVTAWTQRGRLPLAVSMTLQLTSLLSVGGHTRALSLTLLRFVSNKSLNNTKP